MLVVQVRDNLDKHVIECWLRLYNRVTESTFQVVAWPDEDSSKSNIDAECLDSNGVKLGIEHTLIEPFIGEKNDAQSFKETLGSLQNHADLLLEGYLCEVSQPVGAVPRKVEWWRVREQLLQQLIPVLPKLPDGAHIAEIRIANQLVNLPIRKTRMAEGGLGKFLPGRIWPGDPGPEIVTRALERKIPKLANFSCNKRILLLEKDAIAGTIESQFQQLPQNEYIQNLLSKIDQIWSANTACLRTEDTIFTNQLWPSLGAYTCSLSIRSGRFWRGPC